MLVGFNSRVSNNRVQKQNFGAVNQKWLKEIQRDSGSALNGLINDTYAFHNRDKTKMTDLKDTMNEALRLGYVIGDNTKKYYREFIEENLI